MGKMWLGLLLPLLLGGQTLEQKLSSPIEFQAGIQPAYQFNPLNLSEVEKDLVRSQPEYIGNMSHFDSRVITAFGKINYAPRLWQGRRTRLYASLFYHDYLDMELRSYWSTTLSVRQSLGKWRFLEIGWGVLPKLYLRHYNFNDHPAIQADRYSCEFGSERLWLDFEHRLSKSLRTRYTLTGRTERYAAPFAHYDMVKAELGINLRWQAPGDIDLSGELTYGHSENQNELDDRDRSYHYLNFRPSLKLPVGIFGIRSAELDMGLDQRAYLSDDLNDPLHAGRYHQEYRIEAQLNPARHGQLSWYPFFGYRQRVVESGSQAVSDAKSFKRLWLGVRFAFDTHFDIYL